MLVARTIQGMLALFVLVLSIRSAVWLVESLSEKNWALAAGVLILFMTQLAIVFFAFRGLVSRWYRWGCQRMKPKT